MNLEKIEKTINEAFENKEKIDSSDKALNDLVKETIDLLDNGKIRVAEKKGDKWQVNQWIKNNEPWAAKYSNENFINYKTANLTTFLKEINELRKN